MSLLADDAVRHYLGLPYRIGLTRDGDDERRPWRATVEELPGCEARGATPAEAAARIPASLAEWVARAQLEGRDVPEPRDARAYSGKLLLRMPQSLHGELSQVAERNQVSLNAYINGLLAGATGWGQPNGVGATGDRSPPTARNGAGMEPGGRDDDDRAAKLRRFLMLALLANVVVVAIAAAIAVALLLSS